MMNAYDPGELGAWCRGEWLNGIPPSVPGFSNDSRTLDAGQLYVALRGERFDGHEFVRAALATGACGALVERSALPKLEGMGPLLVVENSLAALYDLARAHRARSHALMAGVTGSVGKTTVKEMVADMLGAIGPVARTRGNWNNNIGLPLSLLRMDLSDRAGVFEVGMNHPGELEPLCKLLAPSVAVITNVGAAHLEFFDSIEAIAREKATLVRAVPADGYAVICRDETWFETLVQGAACRIVTVSMREDENADYVSLGSTDTSVLSVLERKDGAITNYTMPLPGAYMKQNALRAVATAREAGVPAEDAARALAAFRPLSMRWNVIEQDGVTFVNDAYNANPLSMRAAMEAFAGITSVGGKWLVLGGMRELGADAEDRHLAVGREVAYGEWAGLVTVGDLGELIARGAETEGFPAKSILRCRDTREAAGKLRGNARAGDAVLLKASRGEQLERVLEYWKDETVKN